MRTFYRNSPLDYSVIRAFPRDLTPLAIRATIVSMSQSDLSPLFNSVSQSNLAAPEKTQLTRLLQELTSPIALVPSQPSRGAMLLQPLQGGAVGATLGILHAELKEGLDVNGVPIDLGLSILSGIGGAIYRSQRSIDLSSQTLAVYSFRKTDNLLSMIKKRRAEEVLRNARAQEAQAAE